MSDPLVFDAQHFTRAWLSVFQAAGTDAKDSQFYRAIHVELHHHGVRLTATNRVLLLTTWVPALGEEDTDAPDIDAAPRSAIVAQDTGKRGVGLCKYVLPLSVADDRIEPLEMTVSVELAEDEAGQGQLPFDDIEGELFVIDVTGMERIRLQLHGGAYPNWRPLLGAFVRRRMTGIALDPDVLARLAALKDWNSGPMVLESSGHNKAARVSIGDGPVRIEGLVMPVKWSPKLDEEPAAAMSEGLRRAVDDIFEPGPGDEDDGAG